MSARAARVPTDREVLGDVRLGLEAVGYAQGSIALDYRFVNYLDDALPTCEFPLLAFGPGLVDYRSACVALGFADEPAATDVLLAQARAAGAALCLIIGALNGALYWTDTKRPTPQSTFLRREAGNIIRREPDLWRPESVLRAKGLAGPGAWQVSLGDHGLIPLLDRQVAERLRALLKDLFDDLSAAGADVRATSKHARTQFPDVVRLVFWLVTARTLIDRDHPCAVDFGTSADDALQLAAAHNGVIKDRAEHLGDRAPMSHRPDLRERAWNRIKVAPYFRNLPADLLAHLYEESLVTPEVRKKLSIHATPRWLAELAASLVPWDALPPDRRRVVELCAGHGPFLMACLEPLRRLQPPGLTRESAHRWLVDHIRSVELDAFSREVCRYALTAAVYPDGDGWDLRCEDVFEPSVVESAVHDAGVVLCNPPFERAKGDQTDELSRGPEGLVRRLLGAEGPECLALVLPRRMVEKQGGTLIPLIAGQYAEIDTVLLPDRVFAHSDVESALLVASGRREHASVALRTAHLPMSGADGVSPTGDTLRWESMARTVEETRKSGILVAPLQALWHQLRHHPRLKDVAEIHRGIEYHRSLNDPRERETLISIVPRDGYARGAQRPGDLHALRSPTTYYLNVAPDEVQYGHTAPWSSPKVFVNAARVSRGPWRAMASLDHEGLWAYQRLHGVWPKDPDAWPLEVLAAVLSGPVAAAHLDGKRDLQVNHWKEIPLPRTIDRARIIRLVSELADLGDEDIPAARMMEIDAVVLEGYRLPARVERDLLRYFDGHDRKGVADFKGYPGKHMGSAFHLRELLSDIPGRAKPTRLLEILPTFRDPALTASLIAHG